MQESTHFYVVQSAIQTSANVTRDRRYLYQSEIDAAISSGLEVVDNGTCAPCRLVRWRHGTTGERAIEEGLTAMACGFARGDAAEKRRFIVWWLVFSCVLYQVVAFPLKLIGVPWFWAVFLAFLIFFVVAIPVIRAARSGHRELHPAKDDDPPEHEAPRCTAPDA
ncbi:hypothetical protein [Arthrobacter sp. A5]|uniref:hypothetical protein n=1 Tax=Arthrobacter sp. A5 TaxID=576926 RepID=UPI003DA7AA58